MVQTELAPSDTKSSVQWVDISTKAKTSILPFAFDKRMLIKRPQTARKLSIKSQKSTKSKSKRRKERVGNLLMTQKPVVLLFPEKDNDLLNMP